MRFLSILIFTAAGFSCLHAQSGLNFWMPVEKEHIPLAENAEQETRPKQYKTFRLDYSGLKTALHAAPMEFTGTGEPILIELPQADGSLHSFRVWESPVMASELAARYPGIRTYAGTAADGSGARVRLGVGPAGFHGYFFGLDGRIQTVRSYARGMQEHYMAYRMEDLSYLNESLARCGVNDAFSVNPVKGKPASDRSEAPVGLRKYRAAISAQAEYSLFHGGTKTLVLGAVTTAMNFINGITEEDLAIRMELVPNNDTLFFFDPDTDPYSGALASSWFGQNPAAVNSLIGINSYDIGHVLCRVANPQGVYTAGIAALGGVCTAINKARAASSLPSPIGERYYLIVAHEMGHQFDATHTFNSCPPSADSREASTAYEPGGGSTIMSYGSLCVPDAIGDEDPYFHVGSIEQTRLFITLGAGATCGEALPADNNAPEVSIPLTNGFYIPVSTPFALTGVATDPDGDALSYCWEQFDTGPETPLGQPTGNAPLFRSYLPANTPTRTFPRIQTIINNASNPTEYLPDYSRVLNFRFTARDGKGGVSWEKILFRSTTDAGPFIVLEPNSTLVSWAPGEYQEVTWDVANTDKAPVNCKMVNIKLSTNGGLTYPITLATNIANTGRYCVQVPNFPTNSARIRVEAADNVFFDISNSNFRIQAPTQPGFSFCPTGLYDTVCLPATYNTVISTSTQAGFSEPITFSAIGLPPGVNANFSPNPVTPGAETVMTLDFPVNQTKATFDFTLSAEAGALKKERVNTISVFFNDFSAMALQSPADGAVGQDRGPQFRWNGVPNANFYDIQVATNPSFAPATLVNTRDNLVADSIKFQDLLEKGTVYYWRVRPKNECGDGAWVGPFAFATLIDVCTTFESIDVPKNITGSQVITVESKINIPFGGIVSDVNVSKIQGFHEYFKDLEMHLISPSGKDVLLFKDKCPNYNGTFNFGFDDSKPGTFGCPPPKDGSLYKPAENLSLFNNENSTGNWTLRIKDNVISSGGAVQVFNLEICSGTSSTPPVLVNNNPLQVPPGANAGITVNLLKTEDANNSDAELLYTLTTIPAKGQLQLNGSGVAMQVGDQFTQVDLNNNGLRYFDYGSSAGPDEFCFTVTDGEGGLIIDCFTIQPFPVSTTETTRALNFLLAPNPASESVRIAFGEALRSDTRIRMFDAAGRMVYSTVLAGGQVMTQLDVARFPEGLYTVAVDNREGSGVRKLVVQ
ncbi:MAG: proprotein convertase P-domain-containing protein [Lewinellaceae bacterium]|nr:proprotein convertase P-domain-containing protein [Lewinellaceae bacterium]